MIVVGVDGSDGGTRALEFAAAEAALRETPLRIVTAWEVPEVRYTTAPGHAPPLIPETMDAFRTRARQVADEASARVRELRPSLQVEALAEQEQPADVLLERDADAELVVVGRRGLGGFESLLLGSVSQQVVQHADLPGRRRRAAAHRVLIDTVGARSTHRRREVRTRMIQLTWLIAA
jgi:nucleotide-binding universal stress UspA family protein